MKTRIKTRAHAVAFTLLEVMIAGAIFFMGMFAVLGVLSNGIHAATLLQKNAPTPVMALALSGLVLTNQLDQVGMDGEFGNIYPDFRWTIPPPTEIMTNGLFQVDVIVLRDTQVYSSMSILLFKPDSKKKM